jgi:PKD repeat protein
MVSMIGVNSVYASPTTISVIFPNGTNSSVDEYFPYNTFEVNINVADVTDLYSFNFKLFYKTAYLTTSTANVSLGPFLKPTYLQIRKEANDTAGYVWCAFSQGIGETKGVNGSGTLMSIRFRVDGLGASSLYLVVIGLGDSLARPIAHEVNDGHFVNSPVHDIAITSVNATTTVILGQTVSVNVTAISHGNFTESFTVNAYRNATAIGTPQTVTNLAAGGRTTLTFTWNTAGVTLGKYFIKANATTVSGETDTTDNTCNKTYDFTKKIYVDITITVIDYPEAVFNYSPTKPLVNQTVTFNASDSNPHGGRITYYRWEFGDGVTAGPTVLPVGTHPYTSHGIYNVTLTIDDSEGLTDKTWKLITIYLPDVVALSNITASPTTVTKPNSISINVTVANVCKYNSTFDVTAYYGMMPIDTQTVPNLKAETNTTLTFTWDTTYVRATTAGTTYEISANTSEILDALNTTKILYELNTTNNGLIDGDVTVIKPEGPSADFTSPLKPVEGQPVNFNASISALNPKTNAPIISYAWDFGDGTSGSGMTATHTYAKAGSYTVKLNVTDSEGLRDAVEATVTVYSLIVPVAKFTENATTVLTGAVIHFNATDSYDPDGVIVSYAWDFGDGTTEIYVGANLTAITTHAYADNGTYNVILTVTDNDDLTNSFSAVKTVLNRLPVALFTESATTVLTDEVIYFNATDSYDLDGDITDYFWTFGDETNTTGVLVEHAYDDNGTYTVTLTVTDDDGASGSASATKSVSNRPPVASFTWSPLEPVSGKEVTFTSTSTDPDGVIMSWKWDFNDDEVIDATTEIATWTYDAAGTYTVTLTVTDNDGLTHTTTNSITVNEAPTGIPLYLIAAAGAIIIIASCIIAYFLIRKKP